MPIQTTTRPQNNAKDTRPKGNQHSPNTRTPRKLATMSEMGFTKVKSTRMK